MSVWIDRLLLVALLAAILALVVTSLPSLSGETLDGTMLLAHMMASGTLIFGLPILAIVFLRHFSARRPTSAVQSLGYWLTIVAGIITIATVFLCMLPVPSTEQMHELMSIHAWAGYAMIPAAAILIVGTRITRSASRPRS